jgi:pimeloyl-ACP methyl ester carboxylesterase
MQVEVNGTRLWFDVDGTALVPDGERMRERPTVVLVHGGPGSYDHSYFKPHFAQLTDEAQLVYVDLRDHGRSARHDPADWSFEACADDLGAFCDALGIVRPVIFGHSMGGIIAMLHEARHPGRARGLILQSTMARFDLERLIAGFRRYAGDEVAALARRDYSGDAVSEGEWAQVFAAFGPCVPSAEQLARRIRNPQVGSSGMECMRRLDAVAQLGRIACPTLVCVGALDPVTPLAASDEILAALPAGLGRLEVIEGAGHFPWLDCPELYWPMLRSFVRESVTSASPPT